MKHAIWHICMLQKQHLEIQNRAISIVIFKSIRQPYNNVNKSTPTKHTTTISTITTTTTAEDTPTDAQKQSSKNVIH